MKKKLFLVIVCLFSIFTSINVEARFLESLGDMINWAYCNDNVCYTGPSTDYSIYKGSLYAQGTLRTYVAPGSIWVIGRSASGYDSISTLCTNHNVHNPVDVVDSCPIITNPSVDGYWNDAMKAAVATILKEAMQGKSWGVLDGSVNGPKYYIDNDPEENDQVANRYYQASKTIARLQYDKGVSGVSYVQDNVNWTWLANAKTMYDNVTNMSISINTITYTEDETAFYLTIPVTTNGAGEYIISTSVNSQKQNDGTYKILKSNLSEGNNSITVTANLSYTTYIAENYSCGDYQSLTPMYIEPKTFTKSATQTITLYKETKGKIRIKKVNQNGASIVNKTVSFDVYNNDSCSGTPVDSINGASTGGDGIVEKSLLQSTTGYWVKESVAPDGYTKSEECKYVGTVTAGQTNDVVVYANIPTCVTRFGELEESEGDGNQELSIKNRLNLYKEFPNYRNLLNFTITDANEACSVHDPISLSEESCLHAFKAISSANFGEENLSDYNDTIIGYDASKSYCLTDLYIYKGYYSNIISPIKAGQIVFSNSSDEGGGLRAIIDVECYVYKDDISKYENYLNNLESFLNYEDYISSINIEEKPLPVVYSSSYSSATQAGDFYRIFVELEVRYNLNPIYVYKMSGKEIENGIACTKDNPKCVHIGYGVLSKFNDAKNSNVGSFNFQIIGGDKDVFEFNSGGNTCEYQVEEEIVTYDDVENNPGKLEIEFRTIDTNNPFNRTPNSNWNDGTNENNSDNALINDHILNATNSYGIKKGETEKQTPKYKITLTPDIVKEIREYNKNNPYDDYVVCDEDDCQNKNSFLDEYFKKGIIE